MEALGRLPHLRNPIERSASDEFAAHSFRKPVGRSGDQVGVGERDEGYQD